MLTRARLLMTFLMASTAHAGEAECWRLGTVEVATHDNAQWTVRGETYTLASGLGSLTLEAGRQAATLERGTARNARVAWSKPPQTWCAGDAVSLRATAAGNFGGILYDTNPVAAIIPAQPPTPPVPLAGVNGLDAMQIRGGEEAELFGSILVAPRPGTTSWTRVARADMGNGQWVGVVYHYDPVASPDGLVSTAPTAPPAPRAPHGGGGVEGFVLEEGDERADDRSEDDGDGTDDQAPTYLSDTTRGWFHLGGGFGVLPLHTYPGGLFELGVGVYTFAFYAGGGYQMTFTERGVRPHGIGYVGVHIPLPVFHPMFGARVSGGGTIVGDPANPAVPTASPSVTFGGQAGFILRKFGGGPGLRVMVEPVYALDQRVGLGAFEFWVSIAGVI